MNILIILIIWTIVFGLTIWLSSKANIDWLFYTSLLVGAIGFVILIILADGMIVKETRTKLEKPLITRSLKSVFVEFPNGAIKSYSGHADYMYISDSISTFYLLEKFNSFGHVESSEIVHVTNVN